MICSSHLRIYPTQVPLAACDIQDGTTFEVAQIKVLQNKRAKARDAISSWHDARCESIQAPQSEVKRDDVLLSWKKWSVGFVARSVTRLSSSSSR